jgi:hypothetical protein
MKIDELSEKQVSLLLDLENQRKKNEADGGKYSDFYLRVCFAAVAKYFDLEGGRFEWFEGLKEMQK